MREPQGYAEGLLFQDKVLCAGRVLKRQHKLQRGAEDALVGGGGAEEGLPRDKVMGSLGP